MSDPEGGAFPQAEALNDCNQPVPLGESSASRWQWKWKWMALGLVALAQLVSLVIKITLGNVYGVLPPVRWDALGDRCNDILVFTPTIHAAISTAWISKARTRGEKLPLIVGWSRFQGCALAALLWGNVIYAFFYYM